MKFYGEKFKKIKKIRNITTLKIAEALGTTRQTVYSWENGRFCPKQSDILLASEILRIDPSEISDINTNDSFKEFEKIKDERNLIEYEKDILDLLDSNKLSPRDSAAIVNLSTSLRKFKNRQKYQKYLINSYENILDNIDQIVYVKDRNHRYKYVNDSFLSITGTQMLKDDIKNILYSRIFEKNDYYELLKLEREVFDTGLNINNRKITIPNTERRLIGLVNVTPIIREFDDQVSEIIVTIKDITKMSYVAERQEQLTDVINSLDEYVFIRSESDNGQKYLFLSNSVEKVYGYSIEEFHEDSMLWYKCIYAEDVKWLKLDPKTNYLSVGEWVYRIRRKDRELRWVRNKIFKKNGINGTNIIFGKVTDITETYKIQKDREELERAVLLSKVVIWVANAELQKSPSEPLKLSFISSNIYSHLGITQEELLEDSSRWVNSVYENDLENVQKFRKLNQYPKDLDFRMVAKSGEMKWINLKIDKHKNLVYGIVRDLTEVKAAERERLVLQEAIENSDSLIIVEKLINDKTSIFSYIGGKIYEIWGITKEQLIKKPDIWIDCIVEADRKSVVDSYKSENSIIVNKYRVLKRDGSCMWLYQKTEIKKDIKYTYVMPFM